MGALLFVSRVKIFKISSEFDPLGRETLRMEFKLALRPINSLENFEEIECIEVDSAKFALMCSSHTDLTVEKGKEALQNIGRIIGGPLLRTASYRLKLPRPTLTPLRIPDCLRRLQRPIVSARVKQRVRDSEFTI